MQDDLGAVRSAVNWKGKKILVAGGAGFLGSWICDALVESNTVYCLDNFVTGLKENIQHLIGNKNFNLIEGDVNSFTTDEKFDFVFNLASRASYRDYFQNQLETLNTNSNGLQNMLEIARKSKCGLLYTSSSEIYGDAEVVPTPETYWGNVNSIGVRSCYDEGKRFGEAMCMTYFREHGVPVKIVRIFNTYGPRIRADGAKGRAIPVFVATAIAGDTLMVWSGKDRTRSFCYVTDTVRGLLAFAQSDVSGEAINIGNPAEITTYDVAQKIVKLAGSKSQIVHVETTENDPKRRCPDVNKARNLLGWKPEVSIDEGLKKTVEWFKNNSHSPYFSAKHASGKTGVKDNPINS